MNNTIQETAELLAKLSENIQTINALEVSDRDMALLATNLQGIHKWSQDILAETVRRMYEDGVAMNGFDLKVSWNRMVADVPAALNAISQRFSPQVADMCMQIKMRSFREIEHILGKKESDEVLAPYLSTNPSRRLVKVEEADDDKVKQN